MGESTGKDKDGNVLLFSSEASERAGRGLEGRGGDERWVSGRRVDYLVRNSFCRFGQREGLKGQGVGWTHDPCLVIFIY